MALFQSSQPAVPVRGLHLDLKGTPPTFDRLLSLLKLARFARYNALLVEWEDMFPWTVDERFRDPTAYTAQQVRLFAQQAAKEGLEIIPLVQCLGHMETPLGVAGYEHLRELPHRSDCLNPLAEGAKELVAAMVEDVLKLLPRTRHFHLGGDEAWSFGAHPDTKAYIARHGKGALYLHHVGPILAQLNARNVRPILWSDMMHDWDSAALRDLAAKADLCPWGYHGHPDNWAGCHTSSQVIARFAEHGIAQWGATCYSDGPPPDSHSADLPDIPARQENALAWVEVARRHKMKGLFVTAWSRFNTNLVQCVPIDAALDALVLVGVCVHDGSPPIGGLEAVKAALKEAGELERFEACRSAMAALAAARRAGWIEVQNLREQLALETMEERRRHSSQATGFLKRARRHLAAADEAAAAARTAFAGLMPELWAQRYLAERIEPLREEIDSLAPRVKLLEPDAWRAEMQGE